MPANSRLVVLAISSLLVSSTWASTHIQARDARNGLSRCYAGDSSCAEITTPSQGRFRRFKRQTGDTATIEADATALGIASDDITTAIDQGAPIDQVTAAATDVVDDASTLVADVNAGTSAGTTTPDMSSMTTTTDTSLTPTEANTDVSDEVKLLADETQNFITNTGAALQDDTPFTEANLQDLANDVQQITAELATLTPPAVVDIPSAASDQVQALKNSNITMDELWAKLEVSMGESLTKDVQFQTMLSYLTPVLAATIAGNVTLPATENLPSIQPIAEITNGTLPVGADTSTIAKLRLAKRGHLEKRFLGSLFSFLGIGFAASASASITTPLGNLGVGVAATLGKLAEVKPTPPEKPQTNSAQQPSPNVPTANNGGFLANTGGFANTGGSSGHVDTAKWAYYRD
ncbi:hypothetical protein ABW21_db0209315 [Orbilia brochopaga]|nr:hypothetical protein ABW21_db0209315 [Drechslerella brochopaga]